MNNCDPMELVCQLRIWAEESLLLSEPSTLAEIMTRYRTVNEIVDRCEKLQISIPEDISTEKINIETIRNASNENREKLTDLAKELASLAKDIKCQLQGMKRLRAKSGRKAPPKELRVTFPDGMVVFENTATMTFLKTLQHIGLKQVSELQSIRANGHLLVSTEKNKSVGQIKELDGFYIETKLGTDAKAKYIQRIASNLNIDITVNVSEI